MKLETGHPVMSMIEMYYLGKWEFSNIDRTTTPPTTLTCSQVSDVIQNISIVYKPRTLSNTGIRCIFYFCKQTCKILLWCN